MKISEIDKVPDLINKAKANIEIIREKEKAYTIRACEKITEHVMAAKLEILKVLNPLNIIHYGSYWMKENDVVYTMADDLQEECNLKRVDLKVYSKHPDNRIELNQNTPNGNYVF